MGVTYFKRFRMEMDLADRRFPAATLPAGYRLLPWSRNLLEAHAEAKYASFRTELDANVFPCLGELAGCLRLMNEIMRKEGFLPEATWLLAYDGGSDAPEHIGTVQGVRDKPGVGAIQNLGVAPAHRHDGLGTLLMHLALEAFQRHGVRRVYLEVTAKNDAAINLYRRMGFVKTKTVYKAVEVAYC